MSYNKYTTTDNGAISLKTTNKNIIDYFMIFVRDLDKKENNSYLEKCWKDDPKKTVAIIFNGRDRINGKKEKKISNDAMIWLKNNKPNTYYDNIMTYINKYGCWKDLLYISYYCDDKYELKLFAKKLLEDKILLDNNENVSLCAKWAPTEKCRNDKRKHMAQKIASEIYGFADKNKMDKYRKNLIVPLRKKINIVEALMCNNEWDKINYQHVPGIASKKLINAFMKHDKDRYLKYLSDVRRGTKEIKVTGILPHELTKYYIENRYKQDGNDNYCETIELQWKTIIENVKSNGVLSNSLAIVDLSGSMFSAKNGSIPAQVATALGIITSICCEGIFKNKFITFSDDPKLVTLNVSCDTSPSASTIPSLLECINSMLNIDYGFSTDFVKCCERIISYGIENNIPDSEMPTKLFVFTDMQFNEATESGDNIETIYENIIKKFKLSGYTAPKFIFWNLNSQSSNAFPVNYDTEGTAIISGFSEQLLKIFMNYDDFNPNIIVNEILEPYEKNVIISDD